MPREIGLKITVSDDGSVRIQKFGDEITKLSQTTETESKKMGSAWEQFVTGFKRQMDLVDEMQARSTKSWADWGASFAASLSNPLGALVKLGETIFSVLVTGLEYALVTGAALIGVFIGTTIVSLEKMSKSVLDAGENFQKFSLVLQGALKDADRARELSKFITQESFFSMATLDQLHDAAKVFVTLPGMADKFKGSLADATTELTKLNTIAMQLAILNPDSGFQGATRALREGGSGNLRGLHYMFGITSHQLEEASGESIKSLETNMDKFLDALKKVLDQRVSPEIIAQFGRLPSQMFAHMDAAFHSAFRQVGDFGLYDFLVNNIKEAFENFVAFFQGDFGTKFAERLSTAMTRSLSSVKDILRSMLGMAGITMGDTLSVGTELITSGFEKLSNVLRELGDWFTIHQDDLADMIKGWKVQIMELFDAMGGAFQSLGVTLSDTLTNLALLVGEIMRMIAQIRQSSVGSAMFGEAPGAALHQQLADAQRSLREEEGNDVNRSRSSIIGGFGASAATLAAREEVERLTATLSEMPGTVEYADSQLGKLSATISNLAYVSGSLDFGGGMGTDEGAPSRGARIAQGLALGEQMAKGLRESGLVEVLARQQVTQADIMKALEEWNGPYGLPALLNTMPGFVGEGSLAKSLLTDEPAQRRFAEILAQQLGIELRALQHETQGGAGKVGQADSTWDSIFGKGFSKEFSAKSSGLVGQFGAEQRGGLDADSIVQALNKVHNALQGAFSDTLFDAIHGKFDTLQAVITKFTDAVVRAVTDMIAQMALRRLPDAIASMIGLFSGGGGGAVAEAGGFLNTASGTLETHAMGGILTGGFRAFAGGGIASQPTLGLVGEGGQNEAVVPLPNGRSIPVELRAQQSQQQPITIVNTIDPMAVVMAGIGANPNVVINPILSDVRNGGPVFQAMADRARLRR